MIKTSLHILKDLTSAELREIAQLTLVERQTSMLREGDFTLKGMTLTLKGIEDYFQNLKKNPSTLGVILARLNGKLIGWLMISLNPEFPEIFSYHPIISPEINNRELVPQILQESLSFAKKEGITKVRIFLEYNDHLDSMYTTYGTWYENQGLKPRGMTYYMSLLLPELKIPVVDLPKDFEVKPILEVDRENLFLCYVETFNASLDRWNLDLTDEERRYDFDKTVHPTASNLNRDASFALLHKNHIVGFSIVINASPETAYLDDFGIHPEFRRKKLGKVLILLSLRKIIQQGLKTVTLHADGQNTPALALYQGLGFKVLLESMRYEIRFEDNL